MIDIIKEIYYVSWSDIRFMKHNVFNVVIMSLMSPILYLIAFGYGLGDGVVTEGVSYIAFMIPGIVALSSLSSSFSSTSTRLNVQRLYYRSFDEMLMCPIRYSSIVIGKAMLGLIRGLLSCFAIFIIGIVISPEIHFNILFVACVVVSCITFSLLGELAALLAKSHQSMATFNTLIIVPMTFLCGTFFSLNNLPEVFQAILYCIPLTHASECIRSATLDWSFPWISFVILVAFGIAFFMINLYLVKNRRI